MLAEILKAALMGAVQAITEFLPVSSSGHLVLVKSLIGLEEVGITMEVVTHLATALAVIVFLRKRIVEILTAVVGKIRGRANPDETRVRDFRLFIFVLIGSVPAALVGLVLRDRIESLFQDVTSTGLMLIFTGVFVFVTGRFARGSKPMDGKRSLLVGVTQALAIIPGISRSGLTVGGGLALGVDRKAAFEFSLLLSLPAILGASALELAGGRLGGDPVVLFSAAVPAFVGGYFAIRILFRTVIHHRFHAFGYYLVPLGLLVLFL
jgi:undecaprenyl-diphosphatase